MQPAAVFALATVVVLLGGSLLIILNRFAWAGAEALGVFTARTVLIVHRFWAIPDEPFRTIAFRTATEHVGMIDGLIPVAILGQQSRGGTNEP